MGAAGFYGADPPLPVDLKHAFMSLNKEKQSTVEPTTASQTSSKRRKSMKAMQNMATTTLQLFNTQLQTHFTAKYTK